MNRGRIVTLAAVVAASAAIVAGGCQSYNYNPVGVCVVQPGAKQVTLGGVSTADILFVVDDSGSMDPKQQALADNFDVFIQNLQTYNDARVARGLVPFDFHIAVTTSSVFRNYNTDGAATLATSTDRCVGTGPSKQCCSMQPATCVADAACTDATAGSACGTTAGHACLWNGASGTVQCCAHATTGCETVGSGATLAGCMPGGACGNYAEAFEPTLTGCTQGLAQAGGSYPAGSFVRYGTNPAVLHFTKDLYSPTVNTGAIAALSAQFKQNIKVGSCGAGGEQHLQAARLAIQKAVAGTQPGVTAGEWPHAGAKMVVVFVGDEDDCSNPADPNSAIVLYGDPGADTCTANQNPLAKPGQYTVAEFGDFFGGLGRPVGVGVIASADCTTGTCVPATCSVGGVPYGYSPAVRLLGVSAAMRAGGFDVVEGSVCQPFGDLLVQIADLVKAPSVLRLDTTPASGPDPSQAAGQITVLRIIDTKGVQRKVCSQALADAERATKDWWFVDCDDTRDPPAVVAPSRCVFVNHTSRNCEADPGETYSVEYLGQIPPGGCGPASPTAAPSQACADALGSSGAGATADKWWCYGAAGGTGTCVCQ